MKYDWIVAVLSLTKTKSRFLRFLFCLCNSCYFCAIREPGNYILHDKGRVFINNVFVFFVIAERHVGTTGWYWKQIVSIFLIGAGSLDIYLIRDYNLFWNLFCFCTMVLDPREEPHASICFIDKQSLIVVCVLKLVRVILVKLICFSSCVLKYLRISFLTRVLGQTSYWVCHIFAKPTQDLGAYVTTSITRQQ